MKGLFIWLGTKRELAADTLCVREREGIEEDREEPEEFCQEQKEEKECVVANQNNEARTIASIDKLSMELCSKGSTFYANFW